MAGGSNPLLSALASLGNVTAAAANPAPTNDLLALLLNAQTQQAAAVPTPSLQISQLQQLLQLTQPSIAAAAPSPPPPPLQQQQPLNQQLLEMLNKQNAAAAATSNLNHNPISNITLGSSGLGGIATSSSGVALGSTIQLSPTKTSATKSKSNKKHSSSSKSKNTTTNKGKGNEAAEAVKAAPPPGAAAGKKGPTLREEALKRGAKIIACRARGMPMDHNIHVSSLCVCVCVCVYCIQSLLYNTTFGFEK